LLGQKGSCLRISRLSSDHIGAEQDAKNNRRGIWPDTLKRLGSGAKSGAALFDSQVSLRKGHAWWLDAYGYDE
jgi:hypothetical protein